MNGGREDPIPLHPNCGSAVTPHLTVSDGITESMDRLREHMRELAETLAPAMNAVTLIREGDPVDAETVNGSIMHGELVDIIITRTDEFLADWDPNHDTLWDVWEHDPDVDPDDNVVCVYFEQTDGVYHFPASKVNPGDVKRISGVGESKAEGLRRIGINSYLDVRTASQDELSEVPEVGNALAARMKAEIGDKDDGIPGIFVELSVDQDSPTRPNQESCSRCGDTFSLDQFGPVKGDEGELYCSLNCLHEEYNES